MSKLRTTLGKFGEFWALIAYFWLACVRRYHFVNTNFSKLSKEIADPSDERTSASANGPREQWRGGGWLIAYRAYKSGSLSMYRDEIYSLYVVG